jgi:hypothetical protein
MDYVGKESSKVVPLRLPENYGQNDWKTSQKDLQVTARINAGFELIQMPTRPRKVFDAAMQPSPCCGPYKANTDDA